MLYFNVNTYYAIYNKGSKHNSLVEGDKTSTINIVRFRVTRRGGGSYVTRKGQIRFVSLNLVKKLCFDLFDLNFIVLITMNGEILGKIDQHPIAFKSNRLNVDNFFNINLTFLQIFFIYLK